MLAISESGDILVWQNVRILGDGPYEAMLQDDFTPNVGLKAKWVSCGRSHHGAIAQDGSVWTWGTGFAGRLGHGDTASQSRPKRVRALKVKVREIACGSNFTVVLDEGGCIWSWGRNLYGEVCRYRVG
mmetsp:Transcript_4645/g.9319  ORF Transcript_4645/g.9319 Transcript_4645/m.9319 type:complete len:128 (-) Transcript_4645:2669-3052(-)